MFTRLIFPYSKVITLIRIYRKKLEDIPINDLPNDDDCIMVRMGEGTWIAESYINYEISYLAEFSTYEDAIEFAKIKDREMF